MITYKDFVDFVSDTYNKIEEDFENNIIGVEDWEQMFFDALDEKLETDTEKVIAHIYYHDDDTIDETAQGILNALLEKKLLQATCFYDAFQDATVVVCMVEK